MEDVGGAVGAGVIVVGVGAAGRGERPSPLAAQPPISISAAMPAAMGGNENLFIKSFASFGCFRLGCGGVA
ncbi:MAG: hypothetical protein RR209_01190, partial [Angelakisella sp.]